MSVLSKGSFFQATPVKEDSKKRKASKDQDGSQEKISKTASPIATKPAK